MQRRRLLALLAAGTAGCAGAPTPSSEQPDTGTTTDSPGATPTANSSTGSAPVSPAPGDCPTYGDDVVRVVCTDAAPADAPMTMIASDGTVAPPATVSFTLRNGTEVQYDINFYSWSLHKRVDGSWFRVAPGATPDPLMGLAPGEQHTWRLSVDGENHAGEIVGGISGTADVTVPALGGGEYAFGVDGWFAGEGHERKTAFAARFTLDADPLVLTGTGDVEDVQVESDTVTARWTRNSDNTEAAEAEYRLSRVEPPADAPRVLPEQAVRQVLADDPLRDALVLALEHDAREVRLRGRTTTHPPFGVRGRTFVYEGTGYRVSASTIDG